jgi:hypothetical protein
MQQRYAHGLEWLRGNAAKEVLREAIRRRDALLQESQLRNTGRLADALQQARRHFRQFGGYLFTSGSEDRMLKPTRQPCAHAQRAQVRMEFVGRVFLEQDWRHRDSREANGGLSQVRCIYHSEN